MKKYTFFSTAKSISTFALFISAILIFSSCDNSTGNDDDHEHSDPEGIRLILNGATVVEQLPDQDVTGEFELEPGQETELITVYFLDHDGDEFQPDEEEYSLSYMFDDEGIAKFEQHEEDGKWRFHLHAEAEGITNMQILLMHGDHSDFTSEKIHVHVESAD